MPPGFNKELEARVSVCMEKEDFANAIEILVNSGDSRYDSIIPTMGKTIREYCESRGEFEKALNIAKLLKDEEAIKYHSKQINLLHQMQNSSCLDLTENGKRIGEGGDKYEGL